jgi:hypothetical protein
MKDKPFVCPICKLYNCNDVRLCGNCVYYINGGCKQILCRHEIKDIIIYYKQQIINFESQVQYYHIQNIIYKSKVKLLLKVKDKLRRIIDTYERTSHDKNP